MMKNNIEQVGGTHYQNQIQPWDEFKRLNVSWAQGEVTKYLCRWWKKGGIQDLEKGLSIIQKYKTYHRVIHKPKKYRSSFLQQYEEFYGRSFHTFVYLLQSILNEDWHLSEKLMIELIEHFKINGFNNEKV